MELYSKLSQKSILLNFTDALALEALIYISR